MKRTFISIFAALFAAATMHAQEPQDWQNVSFEASIVKEKVAQYLASTKYTLSNSVQIRNYTTDLESERLDQPAEVVVPLPEHEGALTLTYQVLSQDAPSPLSAFSNAEPKSMSIVADATEARIANLTPGDVVEYEVVDAENVVVTRGQFSVNGSVRMLRIDSAFNIRDIGGWPTSGGTPIRYGIIYRGSEIGNSTRVNLTEEDREALLDLGIVADLDLRMFSEGEEPTASPLGETVEYHLSQMADGDNILANYGPQVADALRYILECMRQGKPVYVHCTYGADRTGTVCGLLEGLCGVSIDDIFNDYELSAFSSRVGDRHKFHIYNRIMAPLDYSYSKVLHGTYQEYVRNYLKETLGFSNLELDEIVDLMTAIPESPVTGVTAAKPSQTCQSRYFDLSGRQISDASHGIVIRQMADGSVRKMVR